MKLTHFLAVATSIVSFGLANPFAAPHVPKPYHYHSKGTSRLTNGTSNVPNFSADKLYNLTDAFWNAFIAPNNIEQAKMINSTLFAPDVKGRIDATRTFDGVELNTEYAFGLFSNIANNSNANAFTLLGVPSNYTITMFSANQNIVACTVLINFKIQNVNVMSPVEINGWFTFNSAGQITQYDATFKWLDWQFSNLFTKGMKQYNINSTVTFQNTVANLLAGSICSIADQYCTGDNQQYSTKDECTDYLTTQVPFGESWQMGMNTLLCRMVHQNMVPSRPELHCPHIGKTGGGYCTDDRDYATYVSQKYFDVSPFIPTDVGIRGA